MKTKNSVSAFDAKTHLSRLLQEVQDGSSITITKRGKPVARLVPIKVDRERITAEEILIQFDEIRKKTGGKVTIRKYIEAGRR
jgi:prevent-host-death family protein